MENDRRCGEGHGTANAARPLRYRLSARGCESRKSAYRRPEAQQVSPVYGDFRGLPPAILISGTRDLFLSDTVRTHRKLRDAGVEADLHVFEGQSHCQYLV